GGVKERKLLGPIFGSFYGRYDMYRRHNGPIQDTNGDRFYDYGTDTLRETNRLILQPEISAPFRIGEILRIGPSLQYNEIQYDFSARTRVGEVPRTTTRYLQARLEASTVIERVYELEDNPAIKSV